MELETENSNALACPVDTLVMCKFFNCKKPATGKIVRANGCFCDEHLAFNVAQFGCNFTIEPVNVTELGID